jgi:hypothetical protein
MIITSLNGGLGNQFFQYALARRLSYERNIPLRFDLRQLEGVWSIRQYKLAYFQVQGEPVTEYEKKQFFRYQDKKLFSLAQMCLPYYRRRIVKERSPVFDENILHVPLKVCLQGYWQSQKYFASIRTILQKDLQLKVGFNVVNENMLEEIKNTQSVSMHIRRGDYVSNPITNEVHGVLPLSYYENAVKYIKEKVKHTYFYIFSDDIPWVKENLSVAKNTAFVDFNDSTHDYFDFALMKECKFHIIANSSFSWWAAWLSDYKNKIVIAPEKWFQADLDTTDLLPEDWIKL